MTDSLVHAEDRTVWPGQRRALLATAFLSILLYGFCLPLIGTHLPRLQEAFSLSIARSGLLAGAMAAGFVLSAMGGGWLADAAGLTRICGIGLFLMAGGSLPLAAAQGFWPAASGLFIFGLGAGFTEAAGSAVISELAGARRRALLNLSQVFFGIGAFASPYVAGTLAARVTDGWRLSVVAPAPAALMLGLCFVLGPVVRPHAEEAIRWNSAVRLARKPAFIWLALAMFLYVGGEQGVSQWLPTFAARTRGFSVQWGAWTLGAFWGAVAVGRLVIAVAHPSIDDLKLIAWGGLASAVAALLLVLLPWKTTFLLFAIAIGFFNAGLWPTIMAAAGTRFRRMPGTALGMIAGSGALGWMILQPAVGYVARLPVFESQERGLWAGLLIPVVCFALIALCTRMARIRSVDTGAHG